MCNGLDVISSGGVPTGTGFCSVTDPVLTLVMLMAELVFIASQTSVRQTAACWNRFDGGSSMVWVG